MFEASLTTQKHLPPKHMFKQMPRYSESRGPHPVPCPHPPPGRPLPRIARRIRVRHVLRRSQKAQNLVDGLGNVEAALLPLVLGPQVLEDVVADNGDDKADVVVLERPADLLGEVDEVLWVARAERVARRLRHLELVGLRGGGGAREEVAAELGPRAAHKGALQPLVELGRVLEGEQLEDEALVLRREVRRRRRRRGAAEGARRCLVWVAHDAGSGRGRGRVEALVAMGFGGTGRGCPEAAQAREAAGHSEMELGLCGDARRMGGIEDMKVTYIVHEMRLVPPSLMGCLLGRRLVA